MKNPSRQVTAVESCPSPGSIYTGKSDKTIPRGVIVFPRLKKEFNDWMFNQLPNKTFSSLIIFCLAMIFGLAMGFVKSLSFDIMEFNKGKDNFDTSLLSVFSLVYLPLSYKVFCAPIVDIFYWNRLGKCKTYLVSSGFILSTLLFALSAQIEELIRPDGVKTLTIYWYAIFQVLVFFQCSADIFLLKICPDASKAELSMFQDLGCVTGEFLAFNVFLPLNSIKFLNKDLFKKKPLTPPLITHQQFMVFMASFTITVTLFLLIFIGERSFDEKDNKKACIQLGKIIPRFFKRPSMIKLFLYIVSMRVLRFTVGGTMLPKLSNLGFSKADLANIDTVTFPIFFLFSFLFLKRFMVGRQMRMYHIMVILCTLILFFRYFILIDYDANRSYQRTFWSLAVFGFIEKFTARPVYLLGFISTIAPVDVGSTFVSLFMSISVSTQSLPNSFGLWLVNHLPVSYELFVLVPLSFQALIWLGTTAYAFSLDFINKELFDVTKDASFSESEHLFDPESVSHEIYTDVRTVHSDEASDYIPRNNPSMQGRESAISKHLV